MGQRQDRALGERRLTQAYAWFLATWAKRMSWTEVARSFHTSWENVFRSVEMAVAWGREHMALDDIKAIGIDEIFLDRWCTRVMRSQIGPMKKVARSLRKHRVLPLNWFHAKGAISCRCC